MFLVLLEAPTEGHTQNNFAAIMQILISSQKIKTSR